MGFKYKKDLILELEAKKKECRNHYGLNEKPKWIPKFMWDKLCSLVCHRFTRLTLEDMDEALKKVYLNQMNDFLFADNPVFKRLEKGKNNECSLSNDTYARRRKAKES